MFVRRPLRYLVAAVIVLTGYANGRLRKVAKP